MNAYRHPLDELLLREETYNEVIFKLSSKLSSQNKGLKKAPLVKELSMIWILENQKEFIKLIINTVVKEDFEFSVMKMILLKTDEKERKIYISNLADRITLMVIQDVLAEELNKTFSPNLFSFRKGYGPKKAALALSKYLKQNVQTSESIYFLGRDISSYGDNIDHEIMDHILDTTKALEGSKLLRPLLKMSYRCEYFIGTDSHITSCNMKGIPSGSPIVPILENLYLRSLDEALQSFEGSFYARYGDDFIFLTTNENQAREAKEKINSIVNDLKLTVSAKKEKNYIMGKDRTSGFQNKEFFEWIGFTFYREGTYSFRPKHRKQYKQKTKREIGNFTHHLSKSKISITHVTECINSAFNELNSLSLLPEVQKLVVLRTHIKNTKIVDEASRKFLIRCLCKSLKIERKAAWKIFRRMKLHSLEYQRRKLKCNKAA